MSARIDPLRSNIYRFPMPPSLSATDEAGATPVVSAEPEAAEAKEPRRSFLKGARRDLSEDEARSAAGVRWLQAEADRLEQECGEARSETGKLRRDYDSVLERYHDQRVDLATLQGTRKISIRNEILASLCLVGGSSGLSLLPTYLDIPWLARFAYIGLVVCALLFLGGIACRIWK